MKIEVKKVSKNFDNNIVIDNISVHFDEGKIYGIYGRNGSGKSVFLKLLCDFYHPDSGEVLIDGKNYANTSEFPPGLRALIEKPGFFPDLTGYDNLKLLANIEGKISDKEINDSIEIVMKQKLGIAQVIMENPKIMILDEPFNGVEEETVKKLINYFKSIKKDKIIIICSHIKEDLDEISDVIYHFDLGKIVDEK